MAENHAASMRTSKGNRTISKLFLLNYETTGRKKYISKLAIGKRSCRNVRILNISEVFGLNHVDSLPCIWHGRYLVSLATI